MKTALRTVALCLLISNVRGFANDDYKKLAVELITSAAKLYVGTLLIIRGIEAAQVITDKVSDQVPSLGTVLDYTVDPLLKAADIRQPLFASDNRSK